MFGTDYFQIIHGEGHHIGELTPTGTFTTLERGTAMQRSTTYGDTHSEVAGVAEGLQGFLAKKVTDTGPSFENMTLGYQDLPAKIGQKVTLVQANDGDVIEVEGEPSKAYNASSVGHLVTSGTGAISGSTAAGTELSLQGGRWRVAQTGDVINGKLISQLTPVADASNIRIKVRITQGRGKK